MLIPGIRDKILSVLKENEKIPIYKVAGSANVSVQTASKYCYILAAENKLNIESFGNMKLVSKKMEVING